MKQNQAGVRGDSQLELIRDFRPDLLPQQASHGHQEKLHSFPRPQRLLAITPVMPHLGHRPDSGRGDTDPTYPWKERLLLTFIWNGETTAEYNLPHLPGFFVKWHC